jgi:peroxiredoxin/outer membrane lipoprotein-sorting protein
MQTSGVEVYQRAWSKLNSHESAQGTYEITIDGKLQTTRFRIKKPNFYEIIGPDMEERCDSKSLWLYRPSDKMLFENELHEFGPQSPPFFSNLIGPLREQPNLSVKELELEGRKLWEIGMFPYPLLLDRETLEPFGTRFTSQSGEVIGRFKDVKYDVPIDDASFTWKVPAGSKVYVSPLDEALLKVGAKAPEFTIKSPAGETISLSTLLKGKKGALLNFWFLNCPPCMEELPVLDALYPKMKAAGIELLSINTQDGSKEVAEFWSKKRFSFNTGLVTGPTMLKAYGINFAPTNYVVDSEGTIVAVIGGFDEKELLKALRDLGMKG